MEALSIQRKSFVTMLVPTRTWVLEFALSLGKVKFGFV